MKNTKKLGIWMDHASAHLTEFTTEPMVTTIVESQFTHHEKEDSLKKSENLMHHKEQHEQSAYYKKLGAVIKNYEEVILFGPTEAKNELFNLLSSLHGFENTKIRTLNADKMTENLQHIFVTEYFSIR